MDNRVQQSMEKVILSDWLDVIQSSTKKASSAKRMLWLMESEQLQKN